LFGLHNRQLSRFFARQSNLFKQSLNGIENSAIITVINVSLILITSSNAANFLIWSKSIRTASTMKNQVQLITYADRLGGSSLSALHRLLNGTLAGLFGGVHILPFYYPKNGTDAGFDPIDHMMVDPSLGSWADVKALGQDVDLIADLIVNHVSAQSPQF
jgi:hypothetical protein